MKPAVPGHGMSQQQMVNISMLLAPAVTYCVLASAVWLPVYQVLLQRRP